MDGKKGSRIMNSVERERSHPQREIWKGGNGSHPELKEIMMGKETTDTTKR